VELAGRRRVGELDDRGRDPAPDCSGFMVAGGLELADSQSAFGLGLVAVALQHELRRPPDVDLGYHAGKAARSSSIKV
jgi:hypothetical protein